MRGLHADLITAPRLPLVIEQPRTSNAVLIGLLVVAIAGLSIPLAAFVHGIAGDPAVRDLAAKRPFATTQVLTGSVTILSLFVGPLLVMLGRAFTRRTIMIGSGEVTVLERGLFRSRVWIEPLAGYSGVSRRLRSNLSGVHGELVLAHPNPRRSLVLKESARITDADVEDWSRVLDLAEIRSRDPAMARGEGVSRGPHGSGRTSHDVRFAA